MDSQSIKTKDPEDEEMPEGGLSPEMLSQIADSIPDLEIDFSSPKQKFVTGLEPSLPMAPIVNHMRGGIPPVLPARGVPPLQGAGQQGAPQGAAGGNQVQGQQPQGQGGGPPPPPQRYAWEDDVARSDNSEQTMLC